MCVFLHGKYYNKNIYIDGFWYIYLHEAPVPKPQYAYYVKYLNAK